MQFPCSRTRPRWAQKHTPQVQPPRWARTKCSVDTFRGGLELSAVPEGVVGSNKAPLPRGAARGGLEINCQGAFATTKEIYALSS